MRDWLRDIRKKKGMTEKEVAEAAGTAQSVIHRIETGEINPSPNMAMRIADVLGFYWARFFEEKAG